MLTHLQSGCQGGLCSSWDRNSKTYWGANGDAGQYLRIDPNGEAVMMEIDGPGVIYRTWSANPMGKIRLHLDGAETPSFEWNFPDLFDGKLPPFIKPLVYRRDRPESASDCYLPIPFAKHIKLTADKPHGQYYHFLRAGPYGFVVRYTRSWDYASIQAFLDGKPFGPVADTDSQTVVAGEPLTLGI
jgi:hypothetical protein